MEFVKVTEVKDLLKDHGITPESDEGERVFWRHEGAEGVVRLHLTSPEGREHIQPHDGARVVIVDAERLSGVVDDIIHKLRLRQVLLFPIGKWRDVFDAVAFSLAGNEDWQEVDAAAAVELNGRHPLFCEAGDFQTVSALTEALLRDAETPNQGLMLTTTTTPLLVEIVPTGAIRVSLGNEALADEILEAFQRSAS